MANNGGVGFPDEKISCDRFSKSERLRRREE
jgi:hypothetical protein